MTSLFLEAYSPSKEPVVPNWMREERYMYCEPTSSKALVKHSLLKRLLQIFS